MKAPPPFEEFAIVPAGLVILVIAVLAWKEFHQPLWTSLPVNHKPSLTILCGEQKPSVEVVAR